MRLISVTTAHRINKYNLTKFILPLTAGTQKRPCHYQNKDYYRLEGIMSRGKFGVRIRMVVRVEKHEKKRWMVCKK